MDVISERKRSLSHINQDVIACHLLDVHLFVFLILLIAISIHQLTLKNLPSGNSLFVVSFHLSEMMWFWGKFIILSVRAGVGKSYRETSMRDPPSYVTDGMKTTKPCPWKRRGSSSPWFSYQRVHGYSKKSGFAARSHEFKSRVCRWPAMWFRSSHQVALNFSVIVNFFFFTINHLIGLFWGLDETMHKRVKRVMQMEVIINITISCS